MHSINTRNTRMLLLLMILQFTTVTSFAQSVVEHTCRFDELNPHMNNIQVVQELPNPNGGDAVTLTTNPSDEDWKPIRIRLWTKGLDDKQHTCPHTGTRRRDPFGELTLCEGHHILTEAKKSYLKRILRSAVHMHSERLNVIPLGHGLKVPTFEKGFCSLFPIPNEHKTNGVKNADMILYLTSLPSRTKNFFAAAAPCATLSNGRPVIGALSFNPRYIDPTPYVVRVAAHEMAHALGFTFQMIEKHTKVERKLNIRWKSSVTEARGQMTVTKTREFYNDKTATGMELEDEAGVLKTPSRSHWERRNARDDLMAGIVNRGQYSNITLGLFHDLGFYRANFEKAEDMEWGKNEGYNFLNWGCFMYGKNYFPKYFCEERDTSKLFCTHDKRGLGYCTGLVTYNSRVPYHYEYFNTGYMTGHKNLLTDRCPIIQQNSDGDCRGKGPTTIPGLRAHDAQCMPKAHSWWYNDNITEKDHEALCGVPWHYYRTPYVFVEDYLHLPPCYEKDLSAKVQYNGSTFAVTCPRRQETDAFLKSVAAYDSVLLKDGVGSQFELR